MGVEVTKIQSRTVKTYKLTIDGGEVRAQPYSRQGRQYRVTWIEVVKADGNVYSITLGGTVLKKDGTDSQLAADERLYGEHNWPSWLPSIIKGLA